MQIQSLRLVLRHRIGYALGGLISAMAKNDGEWAELFPAICAIGSWLVFRFVWNITPELKAKMAQKRPVNR